jgi:hypothetical protein
VQYRAVIFDLGGVVLPSPFEAFRAYERRRGLPHRFISGVIVRGGDHGAWSRFERGELAADEFAVAFAQECATAGGEVSVDDLFAAMRADGEAGPRVEMVAAIRQLRRHGLRTAALTNNWVDAEGTTHVRGPSPPSRSGARHGARPAHRRGRRGGRRVTTGWRGGPRRADDRSVRSIVRRSLVAVALAALALGAAACGSGGDTQGRQEPELSDVEAQVAQLRLEVQSLRQEVKSLRESVPTTTTTTTGTATTTR